MLQSYTLYTVIFITPFVYAFIPTPNVHAKGSTPFVYAFIPTPNVHAKGSTSFAHTFYVTPFSSLTDQRAWLVLARGIEV